MPTGKLLKAKLPRRTAVGCNHCDDTYLKDNPPDTGRTCRNRRPDHSKPGRSRRVRLCRWRQAFEAVLAAAASHGIGGPDTDARNLAHLVSSTSARPPPSRGDGSAASLLTAVSIALGKPSDAAEPDRRFADRAWNDNAPTQPARTYLPLRRAAPPTASSPTPELDWRTRERLQMPVENVLAALAPTNNPLTNPECWKEVIDTCGGEPAQRSSQPHQRFAHRGEVAQAAWTARAYNRGRDHRRHALARSFGASVSTSCFSTRPQSGDCPTRVAVVMIPVPPVNKVLPCLTLNPTIPWSQPNSDSAARYSCLHG